MKALKNGMRPIHPGEVLREEFLIPMKLTAHSLAIALHVPAPRINDIARERRAVSADTAMRLARFFNMSPEFWMGLQADYEMAVAREQLAEELKTIRPFKTAPQLETSTTSLPRACRDSSATSACAPCSNANRVETAGRIFPACQRSMMVCTLRALA